MRYLKYKNIIFDSFEFGSNDLTEQIFENTDRYDLQGLDNGSAYICKTCINKYKVQGNVSVEYLTEEKNEYICCVKGCRNKDAYQIYFDIENSELI